MNNYYIPELSEFKVGFKYDLLIDPEDINSWVTFITPDIQSDSNNTKEQIDNFLFDYKFFLGTEGITNRIRVKYLDIQDIEELGFTQNTFVDGNISETYISTTLKNNDIEIYLGYNPETHQLNIRKYIPEFSNYLDRIDYKCEPLFNGFIKNKSELKTLLKQLNINEK